MSNRLQDRVQRLALMTAVALLITAIALATTPDVSAGNPNPGILPPNAHPFGQTYGEWAADWWTWMVGAGFYPNFDQTGDLCDMGQSGKVWFLAGQFFDGLSYERDCEVPTGKALFFPVQNSVWFSWPDDPYIGYPDYPEPGGEEVVRAGLKDGNDACGGRSATIDGVAVEDLDAYRVTSPSFESPVPEDNAFGLPELTLGPNFDDGWYLMLAPLSRGEHTISFTGCDGAVDVTYHLTVVGGKK